VLREGIEYDKNNGMTESLHTDLLSSIIQYIQLKVFTMYTRRIVDSRKNALILVLVDNSSVFHNAPFQLIKRFRVLRDKGWISFANV